MKILLVTPYFFEPHRWNISAYKSALSLARIGRDVVVFTSGSSGQPPVEEIGPNLKVYRFRDIFLPDPVNYGIVPFLFPRLWRVIRKERPTHFLIFTHMFHTSLSAAFFRLLGKNVTVVTDTFPGIAWFSRSRLVNVVLWIYARTAGMLVLKSANRVVLLHEGLVETARRIGLKRTVVHPYGVEWHRYENPPPPRDVVKKDGEILISYVGRLESVKGYTLLLDIAEETCRSRPNVRFLFIGDTAAKDDLVSRYESNGITFLGHREDVPSLLSLTDVFVLASYSEGLPAALMEAMASGCACLATRVGGIPYLLGNEEAGLTVPSGDRQAFKDNLVRLIEDEGLRRRLGARARATIKEHYQMDELASRLADMLRSDSETTGEGG
jgi:glycosyltransferase involved in cell wall biosynthesis